jgi:hypothetical protein
MLALYKSLTSAAFCEWSKMKGWHVALCSRSEALRSKAAQASVDD